jgi:hypothetical protein
MSNVISIKYALAIVEDIDPKAQPPKLEDALADRVEPILLVRLWQGRPLDIPLQHRLYG